MTRRAALATPVPPVPSPTPARLWRADYDRLPDGSTATQVWGGLQLPNNPGVGGSQQPTRCRVVSGADVPGSTSDRWRPAGKALRFELRPFHATGTNADGDVTDVGDGTQTSRVEVHRTPADPVVGEIRYYGFSVFLPPDFLLPSEATGLDPAFSGVLFMQWKGATGGSPPVHLGVMGDRFDVKGTDLGSATRGIWHRFVYGIRHDPAAGWLRVFRNGEQVRSQVNFTTVDYQGDGVTADPQYLKQGLYRSPTWAATHVVYLGPLTIGTTLASVA